MRRQDPLEALVGKGKGKSVALQERRSRSALPCNSQHRLALIEADHFSAKVAGEEACATGHVKHTCRTERGENSCRLSQLLTEPGQFLVTELVAPRYASSYSGARLS